MKYIEADKLIKSVKNYQEGAKAALNPIDGYAEYYKGKIDACKYVQELITAYQQEQPKLFKDERFDTPDYERGFKQGRDYQAYVEREYANKDKVIEYLVNKGYSVSTNVEIPTYQETFDMIYNAIKYVNQQEQSEMELEKFTEKMDTCKASYNYPDNIPIKEVMAFTARMFYQYPNVARQWYEQQPKSNNGLAK